MCVSTTGWVKTFGFSPVVGHLVELMNSSSAPSMANLWHHKDKQQSPSTIYDEDTAVQAGVTPQVSESQTLENSRKRSIQYSTTSSPVSSTLSYSTDESHYDDNLSTTSSIYDTWEWPRRVSHELSQTIVDEAGVSPTSSYTDSLRFSDYPLDLSKPKASTSLPHPAGASRLGNLLTLTNGKRCKISRHNVISETGPLNLSKKSCHTSHKAAAVNMGDAIDNPLHLVELSTSCRAHVTAKISTYFDQVIQRAFSLDTFAELCQSDQLCLLTNCWHRLLLWICAHHQLSFHVTSKPETSCDNRTNKKCDPVNQPSMSSVKCIATFISKYERLEVEEEELNILFAITLFNTTEVAMYEPTKICHHRKRYMKQLHSYLLRTHDIEGVKRYTDLLLYLPLLYGIKAHIVESLLCSNVMWCSSDVVTTLKRCVRKYRSTYIGGHFNNNRPVTSV